MALGSSVINKSSKKLAPKAPARRKPAGESTQSTQQSETQTTADSQAFVHDASNQVVENNVTENRETVSKAAREQLARQRKEQRDEVAIADAYLDEFQSERPTKRRRVARQHDAEEAPIDAAVETQQLEVTNAESVLEENVQETASASEQPEAAALTHADSDTNQRPRGRNVGNYLPTPEASQVDTVSQQQRDVSPAAQVQEAPNEPLRFPNNQTQAELDRERPANAPVCADSTIQSTGDHEAREPHRNLTAQNQDGDVEMQGVTHSPYGYEPAQSISSHVQSDRPSTADAEALLALRNASTSLRANTHTQNTEHNDDATAAGRQAVEVGGLPAESEQQSQQVVPTKKTRQPRQPRKQKSTSAADPEVPRDTRETEATSSQITKKSRKQNRELKAAVQELLREDDNNDPTAKGTATAKPTIKQKKARKSRTSAAEPSTSTAAAPAVPIATMTTESDASANNAFATDTSRNDTTAPEEATNGDLTPTDQDATTDTTKRKGGRKREETPEENEDNEIDESTTSMYALTKDTRQGKVSTREREFRKINWVEVAARRREAEAEAKARAIAGEDENREEQDRRNREADDERRRNDNAGTSRGPQLRLVNGQMVLDTESLVVDSRRNADNVEAAIEESDLTKRINSNSFLYDNRRAPEERFASTHKSDPWTESQTDAFYEALRMFGTDFFIISKMFPGKTRRHIKLKFVREERADPERVKRALVGEKAEDEEMNMTVYCAATGQEEEDFKDPEVLKEELRKQAEVQKEEIEREREEAAEVARKKQEAAKEKTTRTKRSRKKAAVDNAGGDPEIDLGVAS